jgi:uncharacterized protein YaaW (UPF0174 family)
MLESKLSEDPVYINYCQKVEEQENLKEKLKNNSLEKSDKIEIKNKIQKLQIDIDSICDELREKI